MLNDLALFIQEVEHLNLTKPQRRLIIEAYKEVRRRIRDREFAKLHQEMETSKVQEQERSEDIEEGE